MTPPTLQPLVRSAGPAMGSLPDSVEHELAEMIRQVPAIEPLSPQAVARVRSALSAREGPRFSLRALWWGAVCASALLSLQIGVAAMGGWPRAARRAAAVVQQAKAALSVRLHPAATSAGAAPREVAEGQAESEPSSVPVLPALSPLPTALPSPARVIAPPLAAPSTAPSAVSAAATGGVRPSVRRASASTVASRTPELMGDPRPTAAPPAPAPLATVAAAAPSFDALPPPPLVQATDPTPAVATREPSVLATEANLLRVATVDLHAPGGAATALQALTRYRQQFPHGTLEREADLAELDARLQLGERGRALTVVERLEAGGESAPRAHELRVIHGELLAQLGDCNRALSHLKAAEGDPPDLVERALYGRGSCFASLGRQEEARWTLREYLRRFPQGRFATQAARALAGK